MSDKNKLKILNISVALCCFLNLVCSFYVFFVSLLFVFFLTDLRSRRTAPSSSSAAMKILAHQTSRPTTTQSSTDVLKEIKERNLPLQWVSLVFAQNIRFLSFLISWFVVVVYVSSRPPQHNLTVNKTPEGKKSSLTIPPKEAVLGTVKTYYIIDSAKKYMIFWDLTIVSWFFVNVIF